MTKKPKPNGKVTPPAPPLLDPVTEGSGKVSDELRSKAVLKETPPGLAEAKPPVKRSHHKKLPEPYKSVLPEATLLSILHNISRTIANRYGEHWIYSDGEVLAIAGALVKVEEKYLPDMLLADDPLILLAITIIGCSASKMVTHAIKRARAEHEVAVQIDIPLPHEKPRGKRQTPPVKSKKKSK